jgi:hypothetical protein
MFAPAPGDDATQIARKISGSQDFMDKLSGLAAASPTGLTPQIVGSIASTYYQSVMSPPPPVLQTDPNANAALMAAFGQVPQKRIADGSDVDPNQALALGGFALANMLTGKGTAADAVRSVNTLQTTDQARVDADWQNQMLQDELGRQAATEIYKRGNQVADESYKQEGYFAHDERSAMRQAQNNLDMMGRQVALQNDRDLSNDFSRLQMFVQSGDPVRAGQEVDLFMARHPQFPIPDGLKELSPTFQQQQVQANTAQTQAKTQQIQEATKGLQFKNSLDQDTYQFHVQQIQNSAANGALQLKKLRMDIDHLPQQYQTAAALSNAKAMYYTSRGEAAIKAADAAFMRAGKPNDGLKQLSDVVRNYNTGIDNQRNLANDKLKQMGTIDTQLQHLQILGGGMAGAFDKTGPAGSQLIQQKTALKQQYDELQRRIENDQSKSNEAADMIYHVVSPGH